MFRRAIFPASVLFTILSCLILSMPSSAAAASGGLDFSGKGSFRDVRSRDLIDKLKKNTGDPDTASRIFRLGVAYLQSGDTLNALLSFQKAPLQDPVTGPLVWELLGDLMAKKKLDSAVGCYERILAGDVPSRFRARIYRKICNAIKDDTAKILSPVIRGQYYGWRCEHRGAVVEQACLELDSVLRQGNWPEADRFVSHELTALNDTSQAIAIDLVIAANPPDSAFSAANFFLLARIAADCSRYAIAERMLELAQAKDEFPTEVGDRGYLRFRGRLSFMEGKNQEAVNLLTGYIKRYGYQSDLGLLVARAYKMLDLTEKAAYWYDRFIACTPHYRSMAEILWRRAWIDEDLGNTASAAFFYQRIYKKFPRSSRAEEAMLRHGLCFFQAGRYQEVISVLSAMQSRYPLSGLQSAAGFWKAKALMELDSAEAADREFRSVIRRDPYDFYAYRARAILSSLGADSLALSFPVDTMPDTLRAIHWFDSIAPAQNSLSTEDSITLRRAIVCALIGRVSDAEIFFGPIEFSSAAPLSLEFRIAQFYQRIGAYSQAIRLGRKVLFRIPLEHRASLPFPVRRLLFPDYYREIIRAEAARWKVEPSFVWAVIRQESVFDAQVVSPVGAIGLMQIMPSTGKIIARELGENFSTESLYTPAGNIRFGTYYLRKLLDQFNDSHELTLAGYNGGPPNARQWLLKNKEKDADLLIEGIGFSETRTYVKRVMANYWFYKILDGK